MLAERPLDRWRALRVRSPWSGLALRVAGRLAAGRLILELPDGSEHVFEGRRPGPQGRLRLIRPRALRRYVTGGALGFAEAYVDRDWDTPDLPPLLELLALNEEAYAGERRALSLDRLRARLAHLVRANTRRGSRRNILSHYDLGNAFFQRWLDPGMTYSAARFGHGDGHGDESLEQAQRRKFESLAGMLALRPDAHLLEIGCGWGGFAEFAAREAGARVTAITISNEQHAYARERIQKAGLTERVEVRLQDYRDVQGRFDAIGSIEMFEAVGERYWPLFFAHLRDLLRQGGRAGLQVITIGDEHFESYRRGCDFIQRHVFPGGMLPSPAALTREIGRAGLVEEARVAFGRDYARTLGCWNRRFQVAWAELRSLGFDDRFKRLWDFYLAYCEAGFRVGFTDVLQLGLVRR